jgi:hypothetical protein
MAMSARSTAIDVTIESMSGLHVTRSRVSASSGTLSRR